MAGRERVGRLIAAATLAILAPGFPGFPGVASAQGLLDGYLDHARLSESLAALAGAHPNVSRLETIGRSGEGRELHLLTLSSVVASAGTRPAILIVAGIDGRHLVGTEAALRVARLLIEQDAEVLADMTIYIVPRLNPDGAERMWAAVNEGFMGTPRPVDGDRDGAIDEDGPVDLNGDGHITQMRRLNPPIDDPATHLADPADPRLLRTPDPVKGQRATYSVYVEGRDQDGDGRIAEDGLGMVDLDRNFMHGWPEHAADAGRYPLDAPESAALASFVLAHPNIAAAIVYGRHDTVVTPPEPRGNDAAAAPNTIDGGDATLVREMGRIYRETTGQVRAIAGEGAGSVHAWLYAQRGLPTFACNVWGRPDPSPPPPPPPAPPVAEGESAPSPAAPPPPAETPADAEQLAWLQYSDRDRGGAGFVEWTPFDHPTLGKVEIGGFVPGFMMNPPASALDDLATKQAAFVVEVVKRRPQVEVEGPTVTKLADGLWQVDLAIVNSGWLPTTTAQARRARAVPPIVVRLSTDLDRIVSGDRVSTTWGLDGSGGRFTRRWIIRAAPTSEHAVQIVHPFLGERVVRFAAKESL